MENFSLPKNLDVKPMDFLRPPRLRYAHILPMWKMQLLGHHEELRAHGMFLTKNQFTGPKFPTYNIAKLMFWDMYLLKHGVILDICGGFQGVHFKITFPENQLTSS